MMIKYQKYGKKGKLVIEHHRELAGVT